MSMKRVFTVLLPVFAISLVSLQTMAAETAPAAKQSTADAIAGTWVLHQVDSLAYLQKVQPEIERALTDFDTVGFCLRYPWKAADEDLTLLEEGLKIARKHNKAFSIRFMAGRHTPARIFDDGCPYYTVGRYGGGEGTEKVPVPMGADGKPNAIFEKHYEAYVSKLAEWCRANDVRLLHMAWYGQDWAELNNGIAVRNVPGYSYESWYDSHERLIDIALGVAGEDLAVEFPFSGHGPTADTTSQFADHVWDKVGPNKELLVFQANGWREDGVWGSSTQVMEGMKSEAYKRPVMRGLQMIQPQNYQWDKVFSHLYRVKATYGEIYTPSFSLENQEQLKEEIAKFAKHVAEVEGPKPDVLDQIKPESQVMHPTISNADAVKGTWALQQVSTVEELNGMMEKTVGPALDTPDLRGFCLRVPWKAIDRTADGEPDYAFLEEAWKVANERNLAFSIRFMAGRHTPDRIFDAGSPFYMKGEEKVPSPFYEDGSPNVIFEREYDRFVAHLAGWCRLRGVRLMHLAWYGQDWAELNHGKEVRAVPGYTEEVFVDTHKRLIEIGLRYAGRELAVEFPFSGYGPLTGPAQRFADFVINRIGPANPIFFCQSNGWGPNGDWGTGDPNTREQFAKVFQRPICRGEQMIQPQDYDWAQVFQRLYDNKATYCEVYTPSFTMERKAQLAEEIKKFKAYTDEQTPLPSKDMAMVNKDEATTKLATTQPVQAPPRTRSTAANAPTTRPGDAAGTRPAAGRMGRGMGKAPEGKAMRPWPRSRQRAASAPAATQPAQ